MTAFGDGVSPIFDLAVCILVSDVNALLNYRIILVYLVDLTDIFHD